MSCYGWERGEVKLPVKEWKRVRDFIYNRYNDKLEECYKISLEVYEQVKLEKKGKRKFNVRQRVQDLAYEKLDKDNSRHSYRSDYYFAKLITKATCKYQGYNDLGKLIKPKKKDFKPVLASKGQSLYDSDLTLNFCNKTKTIKYWTDDNNHSMDAGREGDLGKAFFYIMERVTWTNKTGGFLREYSEYMQDAGQGASISATWGKYEKRKYFKQLVGW